MIRKNPALCIAAVLLAVSACGDAPAAIDPIAAPSLSASSVTRVDPPVWDGHHGSHFTAAQLSSALANDALGSSVITGVQEVGGHYQAAVLSAAVAGFPLNGTHYLSISAGDARFPGNGLNNGPCAADQFYNSLCDVGGVDVKVAIPADASRLRMDYRYWAVDYNPYEDPFWINLKDGNGNTVRFAESTLTTEWSIKNYGFAYSPTLRCAVVDVAAHRGTTVTLQFRAANRYDHIYPSGALIDNLRFDDVSACALPPNPNVSTNQPPVAEAGPNQTLYRTSAAGVSVTLAGSGTDPDGQVVQYKWFKGSVEIATGATPQVVLGLGTHVIKLVVTDDKGATGEDLVTITVLNVAPTVTVSAPMTLECVSGGALASFTAQGSDVDGTIASYAWTSPNNTSSFFAPLGTTNVGVTVTDNDGATGSASSSVTVKDTQAPTVSLTVSQATLWAPNHRMVQVATGITAGDACNPAAALASLGVSVTSNEPVNGRGDGNTASDWLVTKNANGTYNVSVRAERSGTGNGRIYTITATASDGSGNNTTSVGIVTVPKSRGK